MEAMEVEGAQHLAGSGSRLNKMFRSLPFPDSYAVVPVKRKSKAD